MLDDRALSRARRRHDFGQPVLVRRTRRDLAPGWRAWTVGKYKKATEYSLVKEDGRTVIRASANSSASGLSQDVHVDTKEFPLLRWRWKVPELIAGADNTRRHSEDSPVRMIVTFQGDNSKWSFEDRHGLKAAFPQGV